MSAVEILAEGERLGFPRVRVTARQETRREDGTIGLLHPEAWILSGRVAWESVVRTGTPKYIDAFVAAISVVSTGPNDIGVVWE